MISPRLILVREPSADDGTPGWLYRHHEKFCRTLELPWRNNENLISCIPVGEYECIWSFSPKFGRHFYELQGVDGRTDVMVHSGNYAGDKSKGFVTDVLGCLLVGRAITMIGGQKFITKSRDTLSLLHYSLKQKPFMLDVI